MLINFFLTDHLFLLIQQTLSLAANGFWPLIKKSPNCMMCPLPLDITLCRNYFSNKRALPPPSLTPTDRHPTRPLSAQHNNNNDNTNFSTIGDAPVQSKDGMVSPTPRRMIARAAGDCSLLMPACFAAVLFVLFQYPARLTSTS